MILLGLCLALVAAYLIWGAALTDVRLPATCFFRSLVQTRCAAWFKSEVSGVAFMALLFGLAHAPAASDLLPNLKRFVVTWGI